MTTRYMYLNTLLKLFQKPLETFRFQLPSPVIVVVNKALVQELHTIGPDNRVLIIPLTHDLPSLDAITVMSDRVGGSLNGVPIELGLRAITVVNGDLHIPFFGLKGMY